MQHGEHYKFVAREQHVPVPAPDRFFRRTLFPRARLTVGRSRRHDADKVFGYRFCRCWCCLLALARCHNWVIFPCPDRERQGKRYNRRTILRWSRHSLVYPTIERQNALSIPLIAGSESGGWSSWRRERTQSKMGSAQGIPFRQGDFNLPDVALIIP